MAYPQITKPDDHTPLRLTLCITREECSLLLPLVKKTLSNCTKKVNARRERIGKHPPSDKLMNELMQAEEEHQKLKEMFRHLDALALK